MADIIDDLSFVPGLTLDDSAFTDEEILQAETLLAESIIARQPTLDVSPSTTIYDLLVRPAAIVYLNNRRMSLAIQATQSLKGVTDNPDLASDDVVDAILSNYGIVRKAGSVSQGTVRVNVTRDTVYTIKSQSVFTTSTGLQFLVDQDYTVLSDPTTENQLKLHSVDDLNEQFFFLLPVTSEAAGSAYQLASNVALTPASTIPNFVSSYSFNAFTGAIDSETNEDLIKRMPEALSAKNKVSRVAISSELKSAFEDVIDVKTQGYGDASMLRGIGGILPVKGGGFADIWVRTSLSAESITTTVTAVMEEIDASGRGVCACTVPSSAHPGHFLVASVQQDLDVDVLGSYIILSQTKGIDDSPNKIDNITEGAYSAFQYTDVSFAIDPAEGQPFPAVGQEFLVRVETIGIPLISDIQEYISDRETRVAGTDYLVKASIPCFVGCSPINVYVDSSVNVDSIRNAIFNYINTVPMGSSVFVDGIIMAVRNVTGVNRVSLPIRLYGKIMAPSGDVIDLVSENSLVVPSRPTIQVTPETVAFYVAIDDIALNVIVSE